MRKIRLLSAASAAALAAGAASARGPNLVVPDVSAVVRWGVRDGIVAYSAGTMVCNIGDQVHEWDRFTAHHPVITQNFYRIKDGRFEQIGVSWVKHTFSADIASVCRTCTIPPGYNGQQLGVGCADAYSALINGELWTLGPRSPISASTGVFPFPVDLSGYPAATPTIGRRVQIAATDVQPELNPGARYFAETQFVAAQESAAQNGNDSASFREFTVAANLDWSPAAPTRQSPAIYAWADASPDVVISSHTVPGENSLILLGSRAIDLGDGRWRYLYAVQNVTSDRAVAELAIPAPSCFAVTDAASHLPRYHSGEPWSSAPWTGSREPASPSAWTWRTPAPFASDPNTSAIRWSSVGSFELVCAAPPRRGAIRLGLFLPGPDAAFTMQGVVPGGSADFNADGFLDFFDYDDFVTAYEAGDASADFNADDFLDFFDYDAFVSAFEQGCL